MGVHLILERDGVRLPIKEYDYVRHAGDRDLASAAADLSSRSWYDAREYQHYYVLDPVKLREWGAKRDCNHERWEQITSLFERYPDLRMYVSW